MRLFLADPEIEELFSSHTIVTCLRAHELGYSWLDSRSSKYTPKSGFKALEKLVVDFDGLERRHFLEGRLLLDEEAADFPFPSRGEYVRVRHRSPSQFRRNRSTRSLAHQDGGRSEP